MHDRALVLGAWDYKVCCAGNNKERARVRVVVCTGREKDRYPYPYKVVCTGRVKERYPYPYKVVCTGRVKERYPYPYKVVCTGRVKECVDLGVVRDLRLQKESGVALRIGGCTSLCWIRDVWYAHSKGAGIRQEKKNTHLNSRCWIYRIFEKEQQC